jgi:hypothetical protein
VLKFLGPGTIATNAPKAFARHEAKDGARRRFTADPKLLMLDEPLTGLDTAVARQVKIADAAGKRRVSYPDDPHSTSPSAWRIDRHHSRRQTRARHWLIARQGRRR